MRSILLIAAGSLSFLSANQAIAEETYMAQNVNNISEEVRGKCLGAADFEGCVRALIEKRVEQPQNQERKVEDAAAYNNRGLAKARLKDYQVAIADFTRAIEIDPQYANAYSNRGMAKELVGDRKGACADLKEASSLGHKGAAVWVRVQCQ